MRYHGAIWLPGAPGKQWPTPNACAGVVMHSAEGYRAAMLAEVQDQSVELSWTFSVMRDGEVFQHYELEASCWGNGNEWANEHFVSVEHEGVTGQPLTAPQLAASVALVHWITKACGFPAFRGITWLEHREVAQIGYPNHGPTSCPNGRIPWVEYTKDADVDVTQLDQSASIRFVQEVAANVAAIVSDANGCTVVKLDTPKIPVSPGYTLYGVVVKDN